MRHAEINYCFSFFLVHSRVVSCTAKPYNFNPGWKVFVGDNAAAGIIEAEIYETEIKPL